MTIDPTFFFATNIILGIALYQIGKHVERWAWQKRQAAIESIRRKYQPAAGR